MRPLISLVCGLTLLAAACADDHGTTFPDARHPYGGPLQIVGARADHQGAGAAGNVVDCDTWGAGGASSAAVYGDGATADSPEGALGTARSEGLWDVTLSGLRVAKREPDRVLYVLEVAGRVKEAVIVRDGPATEGAGGPGWYVESWARCDFAELPRHFTDSLGLQIWSDEAGNPVPTTKIQSWKGPEHCDWQSMTFLSLNSNERPTFVRAPQAGLEDYFAERYQAHAKLPSDAEDTGYHRNGDHLWISSDGRRAFVGSPHDVEVWPRTIRPLGCG